MAHFHLRGSLAPVSSIDVAVGGTTEVALWGGGPDGRDLDVHMNVLPLAGLTATVREVGLGSRVFEIRGLLPGMAVVQARLPGSTTEYAAPVWVTVVPASRDAGVRFFYHGTSLEQARRLLSLDLAPRAVPDASLLDWFEYTDFGKGFYTHPEENKRMAVEWAKRKNPEWGVVRFALESQALDAIAGSALHFDNKRAHRPGNAPRLFDGRPANWLEFVEHNRHIRVSTQRDKDHDWTPSYAWMRGPIWGRVDSKLPGGGPPIPDHVHQVNWGAAGLAMLNTAAAKSRRVLFTKENERFLVAPAGAGAAPSGYTGGGGRSGGGGASDSW